MKVGKTIRKTKAHKVLEAVTALNKAMEMDDPHIRVSLPYGVADTPEGREFVQAAKSFVQVYKKYHGLKKVNLDLVVG